MAAFDGFPPGRLRVTPVPDLFFSELLAQIDEPAELKLTLHLIWRLARHDAPRCASHRDLSADAQLQRMLPAGALDTALAAAVARRTLVELRVRNPADESERFYFLNDEAGRRDLALVRQGKLKLQRGAAPAETPAEAAKPNIFALYEQHIGMLTPLIAQQLEDAATQYAPEWVADAFAEAARRDKRSWRYIETILQRWQRDGRKPVTPRKPAGAPALRPKRTR